MQYKVIIPAAGSGKRMGAGMNKLFLKIDDQTIIEMTIAIFGKDERCSEIILPINPDEREMFESLSCIKEFEEKLTFVQGGAERQESVFNGIKAIHDKKSTVLVHDGARPFVTKNIISALLENSEGSGGVICAVPVKDTVKKVEQEKVTETIDRSTLWAVQTPQAFTLEVLEEAHIAAEEKGFFGTDDASLLEWQGKTVKVVMGDYFNIKVTTKEDLIFAEAILQGRHE
jgi:2-C-methyl-D-erythritol 4-phosphate cytidylyltransferase